MDDTTLSWDMVGVTKLPLHGKHGEGKFVLVDGDYDGEYLAEFTWYLTNEGYVHTKLREDGKQRIVYLHHLVCKPAKGQWVRHLNGDQLDCRSVNLKACSPSEVQYLRKPRVEHQPRKCRGVYSFGTKKFYAVFRHAYIGGYASEIAAAKAYDAAAYAHYGDRAMLNFPRSRWRYALQARLGQRRR